jgi:hypothetical protein
MQYADGALFVAEVRVQVYDSVNGKRYECWKRLKVVGKTEKFVEHAHMNNDNMIIIQYHSIKPHKSADIFFYARPSHSIVLIFSFQIRMWLTRGYKWFLGTRKTDFRIPSSMS